jgi:WD40 repeat protein
MSDDECIPEAVEIDTKQKEIGWCLAMSPDNGRIISNSGDEKFLIHDVETFVSSILFPNLSHASVNYSFGFISINHFCRRKLLLSLEHSFNYYCIDIQPRTNGNVFATTGDDNSFYLFDTRLNKTGGIIWSHLLMSVNYIMVINRYNFFTLKIGAVLKSQGECEFVTSVRFSPAESTVLAVGDSSCGTFLYDIRRPARSCGNSSYSYNIFLKCKCLFWFFASQVYLFVA